MGNQKLLPIFRQPLLLEDPTIAYKRQKELIRQRAIRTHKAMALAKRVFLKYEKLELQIRKDHESIDLRLSYFDGRYKVLKPFNERKEAPAPVFKEPKKKTPTQKLFEKLSPEQKAELLLFLES